MEIPIIYEDAEIVVIDKPSGIVCNWSETSPVQTLQDWMAEKLQIPKPLTTTKYTEENFDYEQYFRERVGLVHRLDKETSGVMVFAKTLKAFVECLRQFREHRVHKEYLALTHGIWNLPRGEINLPLGRRADDRQKFGVREEGRESITGYEVVEAYKTWEFPKELKIVDRGYQGFSLVRFYPKTGRTHQIRVHARALGHPVVGDVAYAGRKRSREDRKWAPRVMLHAEKLSFLHPTAGVTVAYTAPFIDNPFGDPGES